MHEPAERHGDAGRQRPRRLVRVVVAVLGMAVLGVPLALAGPGQAGAQELCLDGTVLVVCVTSVPTTTEPPATTTTARPTTTTTEAPPTTEAPVTTEAPTTPSTAPRPTTTTRPPVTPGTVASTASTAATTAPAETVATTATTPTTVVVPTTAPDIPALTTPTTAAPTTFDVATASTAGSITPIGLSQEVAAQPVSDDGSHTAQLAVVLGALAAISVVALIAWRERHRPEAD